MRRICILVLWFTLSALVEFCNAGKEGRCFEPDNPNSVDPDNFVEPSTKRPKLQESEELSSSESFMSHDDYYVYLADKFCEIEDLEERFTKLVELFNVTDYLHYKKASKHIYNIVKRVICDQSPQRSFSLLYDYVKALCPDNILSFETYETKAWGLLMICNFLNKITNFDDQQKEMIKQLTQSLYVQALAYKSTS